jgi:hypothetical protein
MLHTDILANCRKVMVSEDIKTYQEGLRAIQQLPDISSDK